MANPHQYTSADFSNGFNVNQLETELLDGTAATACVVTADENEDPTTGAPLGTFSMVITLDPDVADAEVDTIVVAHDPSSLPVCKCSRMTEIDARTDEMIAAGFTYASKQFSLTLEAQIKISGTFLIKDNPALTYPIGWNTIDDDDTYDIVNAADLEGFYLTALGTIRSILDSGTALKASIRAATTQAELDAVVDNR